MTEKKKRFFVSMYDVLDREKGRKLQMYEIIDLLNELYEEKEDWKNNCLKTVSENSILWNEISILREQGAEPSDAFKNYLNGLTNKIKKLQEDLK